MGGGLGSCVLLVLRFVFSFSVRSCVGKDDISGVWEVEWSMFILEGSGGRVNFRARAVSVISGSFSSCSPLSRGSTMAVGWVISLATERSSWTIYVTSFGFLVSTKSASRIFPIHGIKALWMSQLLGSSLVRHRRIELVRSGGLLAIK